MLVRWVAAVWVAWLGMLGVLAGLLARRIYDPHPLVLGLPIALLVAGLGLIAAAVVRLVRGPRRAGALASLLLGTAPLWFLAGHGMMAMRPIFDRRASIGLPSLLLSPLARPAFDLAARWSYPARTSGRWVEMVATPTPAAPAQVEAMDRHVDGLLGRLRLPASQRVIWYRGSLFGTSSHSLYNMSLGSEVARSASTPSVLLPIDQHEVAHAVIHTAYAAATDPPSVLVEGWAQANQGMPEAEAARVAWDERRAGRDVGLRQLVAPDWYWYHASNAYSQGAPLVNYILRTYGPERFLKLFASCQQATFEADLRAALGVGIDELDAAFWADVERLVTQGGPPARRWLKGLKLAPGVDPAAWDAFLAEYFAVTAPLVASYDHARVAIRYRVGNGPDYDHLKDGYEERMTLLRSGPFALCRQRSTYHEGAVLAHPDHPLSATRSLYPRAEPWQIREDASPSPTQAYRRALRESESTWNGSAFLANHGGSALWHLPDLFRDTGVPIFFDGGLATFEVARLDRAVEDGRPCVRLEIRSAASVPPGGRCALGFTFAVDDSFAVREVSDEQPGRDFVLTTRMEYDHLDGRPVLRSSSWRDAKSSRMGRLDVEECRFGPIPEAEFAFAPFQSSITPSVRSPVGEATTPTWLDVYWIAFALGGVHVAAGTGLALRTRRGGSEAETSSSGFVSPR